MAPFPLLYVISCYVGVCGSPWTCQKVSQSGVWIIVAVVDWWCSFIVSESSLCYKVWLPVLRHMFSVHSTVLVCEIVGLVHIDRIRHSVAFSMSYPSHGVCPPQWVESESSSSAAISSALVYNLYDPEYVKEPSHITVIAVVRSFAAATNDAMPLLRPVEKHHTGWRTCLSHSETGISDKTETFPLYPNLVNRWSWNMITSTQGNFLINQRLSSSC